MSEGLENWVGKVIYLKGQQFPGLYAVRLTAVNDGWITVQKSADAPVPPERFKISDVEIAFSWPESQST